MNREVLLMAEKINLKNYLLPGRIRKKDGYYHLIIDTIHPITKEKIQRMKMRLDID